MKPRLGIYIGSFNPPHIGHIDVVNYLIRNNYVDEILIIPTGGYWDKSNLIELRHRINMLRFFESDKVKVDDKHNNYPYTYELMRALTKELDYDLYLIIGADNIIDFDKWKNYQELLNYKIIIMNRDNIDISEYLKRFKKHNFIVVNDYQSIKVSSTDVRNNLNSSYLDSKVLKYIKDNNLYQ